MKRLLILLLLISISLSVFAEQIAWINPYKDDDPMRNNWLPGTMLSFVSRGIFYDEWDILFRAPAELSNYSGINLLTAYGNYSSWHNNTAPTPLAANNPFVVGPMTPQQYVLGVAAPIAEYRGAVLTGLDFSGVSNNLSIPGSGSYSETFTEVADAYTLGESDYTYTKSYSHTDYSTDTIFMFGGAVDLDVLGAALFASFTSEVRTLGGYWDYEYTKGTDTGYTLPADYVIASSQVLGTRDEGKSKAFGRNAGDDSGLLGAVVQLPLPLAPIVVQAAVGWSNRIFGAGGFNVNSIPVTVQTTSSNITGATTATDIQSYTYVTAAGNNASWENDVAAGILTEGAITAATLETEASNLVSYNPLNLNNLRAGNFSFRVEAGSDLPIDLTENVVFLARGRLGFMVDTFSKKDSRLASSNYQGVAPADFNYTMSYSWDRTDTTTTSDLSMELGGVFEISGPEELIIVGTGLFFLPTFTFETTKQGVQTRVLSKTLSEETAGASGAGDMPVTTGAANVLALVNGTTPYTGTRAITTTTTYDGSIKENTYSVDFVVPLAIRLNLFKKKLQLISGYDIKTSWVYVENIDTQTSTVAYSGITLTDAADGNQYTADTATSVAKTTAAPTREGNYSLSPLSGQMNWMIRWLPSEFLTLDIYGLSIANALNFGIFGSGAGLNLNTLLSTLEISLTLHL